LLWVCFGLLVVPGYITCYKRRSLNLEGTINQQRPRSSAPRAAFRCKTSSGAAATSRPSSCYARRVLPGCKKAFLDFERSTALERWYKTSFGLVPVDIGADYGGGLLCSNHVTYCFGKGMMPKT
ncbi:hypothetical protein B0H13DRAFT_1587514, partial [Mycena leptocephala]